MSYKFVIEGSDLFYLEKDKLSDNMVKRLVITKDKLSTVLKMCHNSSGHQDVNKNLAERPKYMCNIVYKFIFIFNNIWNLTPLPAN
jgi:hypothetical protein